MTRLEAIIKDAQGGRLRFSMANRTGHPENFFIAGVIPEVYVGLDGNTRYAVNLSPDPKAAIVEVRQGGPEGDLLASYRTHPEDGHGS